MPGFTKNIVNSKTVTHGESFREKPQARDAACGRMKNLFLRGNGKKNRAALPYILQILLVNDRD